MTILVGDTNIFIDMNVANLTLQMFRLKETFATPDILYHEELAEHHSELPGLGLRIERLTPTTISDVERMVAIHQKNSVTDLMALALAKERQWPLLSGDRRLREAAVIEGVKIFGTLWLIEQLVATKTISLSQAETGFELMRHGRRRLPWAEVDALLERLSR